MAEQPVGGGDCAAAGNTKAKTTARTADPNITGRRVTVSSSATSRPRWKTVGWALPTVAASGTLKDLPVALSGRTVRQDRGSLAAAAPGMAAPSRATSPGSVGATRRRRPALRGAPGARRGRSGAGAERQVLDPAARGVEAVGVGMDIGVAVGGGEHRPQPRAAADGTATDLDVGCGDAISCTGPRRSWLGASRTTGCGACRRRPSQWPT